MQRRQSHGTPFRRIAVSGIALLAAAVLPRGAAAAAKTVREPAFGLPHFYADTDTELARENGREIAKDRLGQMILVARVGRGTLYQVFGVLDAGMINDDIEARQTAYTSSELNAMYAKMPQRERDLLMAYCDGVNDTIDAVYAGTLPEPIEVTVLKGFSLGADLFGNATNISDQVDPNYRAPGGADPARPNGGYQFTPELAVAIGILQVRNFGLNAFDEVSLLSELQALIAKFGTTAGTQIWDDRHFLTDPLAPVSVPDPTTPGFGGPVAAAPRQTRVASAAVRFPRRDYEAGARQRRERQQHRAEFAQKLGAWPKIGSYAWMIGGGKSATGYPWIGGFPQTGIQTPSIMHFAENRSSEGADHRIHAIGMEFIGAPVILIGQTDTVAYTTTTAQLRVVDTFVEQIVNENADAARYNDEGTPAPLSKRTETFLGGAAPTETRVFWRSHARNGDNGSRAIVDFRGDAEGTVSSATATTLTSGSIFDAAYAGGHVLITDGAAAGQIRAIASATATTLTLGSPWTIAPAAGTRFVAVKPAGTIVAVALDSPVWLEETTAVLGFTTFQRAETIMDVRAAMRLIPSTHNFLAADNQAFNGIGTASGTGGNIGYWSSGFSRVRQGGLDSRLPMDGTGTNPLVVYSGTVSAATTTTITAASAVFGSSDLSPEAINFRYANLTQLGSEFIVSITGGTGRRQTRRIASNTGSTLTVESAWGVTPAPGDTFEVFEIVGMPEAINPSEQYTANWNNKAATADEGENFGREFRHAYILERLLAESSWDRAEQRQLNEDVAGFDGKGKIGRFLVPRLRQAVDGVGNGGNSAVDTTLAALEAHNAAPLFGRFFVDPVTATTVTGAVAFLNSLANQLTADIYGDEYSGAVSTPTGSRALNLSQHAIDTAAGGPSGSYAQAYAGDYFNGADWRVKVRDSLSVLATAGIPADSARSQSTYRHPLRDAFIELGLPAEAAKIEFESTPYGNRGTWEQIVEVGPTVNGEFIFPLGQSGHIEGSLGGVTSIDGNVTSLHPVWRDWRFVPMLHVSQDLAGSSTGDSDGDGILDGYERWYFGGLSRKAGDDGDADKSKLLAEFQAGTDPTVIDTDGDGIHDGLDRRGQDRLRSGALRLGGKIRFGGSPGTDELRLTAKIGGGSAEFDPATKDLTITLDDGDQIYSVTLPAGTLTTTNGKRYVFNGPSGGLPTVKKAIVVVAAAGKPGTIKLLTEPVDLSAADQFDHEVDTTIGFGAHTILDRRMWVMKGSTLKPSN